MCLTFAWGHLKKKGGFQQLQIFPSPPPPLTEELLRMCVRAQLELNEA